MDIEALADEIIAGRRLSQSDDLAFFETCDETALKRGADKIRSAFSGNKVDLCTIINGKSGRCGENCAYCAQSAHHKTACEVYGFLSQEKIIAEAKANAAEGVDRFAIVTAGKALDGEDFEKAIAAYRVIHAQCPTLELCASFGFLKKEQFARLREVGVTSYHDNIETSRRFFPHI
ncbi:MAG: radical SAM protein, partial [Spirochaetaceae bacterium]|nr:radical SAM protein [Spirochaetaceae bacterium]